jgi:hypothetical protein
MNPAFRTLWAKIRHSRPRGNRNFGTTDLYDLSWEPWDQPAPSLDRPISQPCTFAQMQEPEYREWCQRLAEPWHPHRKLWEWCYIGQACEQAGAVGVSRRGLGFGVGTEPLASYFASRNCEVVATDLPADNEKHEHWELHDEHAKGLSSLNSRQLCTEEQLRTLVSFRPVDMTAIPTDLRGFDFVWSSCALEHLGCVRAGLDFIIGSLDCLKAGGIAVHTTEYNVSSNDATVTSGDTVAYRRRDIEELARDLRAQGHAIQCTFALGSAPEDRHVDTPPWSEPHLKIPLGPFVITSFGISVTKASGPCSPKVAVHTTD